MTRVYFPYQTNHEGRTRDVEYPVHINQLIELVLFTAPGERVNRPTFGSGLLNLVFSPGSPELATATQFLVQSALQQWLGDLIAVNSLQVESVDSTLKVTVNYTILENQEQHKAEFTRVM